MAIHHSVQKPSPHGIGAFGVGTMKCRHRYFLFMHDDMSDGLCSKNFLQLISIVQWYLVERPYPDYNDLKSKVLPEISITKIQTVLATTGFRATSLRKHCSS